MLVSWFSNLLVSVIMNVLIAGFFFYKGHVALGVLALLWHYAATILAFAYPPSGLLVSENEGDEAMFVPASIIRDKFRTQILESNL